MNLRHDHLKGQPLPVSLQPLANKLDMMQMDFHFEREWRLASDLQFDQKEILAVYAPVAHHSSLREDYPDLQLVFDLQLLSLL